MSSDYKIIDTEHWKRATHCQVFRTMAQPRYCVSFELDITRFLEFVRKEEYSFTMAFIYAVTKCANDIEEFRYRFLDGKVILYDQIDTSFTYLNPETELLKVITVPMQDSMKDYVQLASETAKNQKEYFTGPMGNDIYQFSSIPWISFQYISHTDSGNKEAATPMFDFGKYYEKDGKVMLPFSVQVHHSFVDGVHIGKLAEQLQNYLNEEPKRAVEEKN